MRDNLKSFYENIASKKLYWIPIVFFAIIAYSFSAYNRTVSLDDLMVDEYTGSGKIMLHAGRWGFVVWRYLLCLFNFVPFTSRFLGAVLLVISSVIGACVLYVINGRKNKVIIYTLFSCELVTYPLIASIWEFFGANAAAAGNMLIASLIILYFVSCEKISVMSVIISGLLFSVVASSYESGMFFYVTFVLIVIFLKHVVYSNDSFIESLIDGLKYVLIAIIAVAFRFVIGAAIRFIMHLNYYPNGETGIMWGTNSLRDIVKTMIWKFLVRGLVYLPITIFVVFAVLFLIYSFSLGFKQKRILPFIGGIIVLFSVSGQTFIQANPIPDRTAQTLSVFCAGVIYMLADVFTEKKVTAIRYAISIFGLYLCLLQASYLNELGALNNQRSTNESSIIYQLGMELESKYKDKPVAFIGGYYLGAWIEDQIRADTSKWNGKLYYDLTERLGLVPYASFIESNVLSMMIIGTVFNNQTFQKYFSYLGFQMETVPSSETEIYEKATEVVKETGMHPYEIKDMGEYVIIALYN